MIVILPRQARDKHRESTLKKRVMRFSQVLELPPVRTYIYIYNIIFSRHLYTAENDHHSTETGSGQA
jgi:hypothetical protein